MYFSLYLYILSLIICYTTATTTNLSTRFSIKIRTPTKSSSSFIPIPYKSIHVRRTLQNSNDQWSMVKIKPFIPKSNKMVRQLTVHLCQISNNIFSHSTIWYDDETFCNGAPSMLVYQWTSNSSLSLFHMDNNIGFQLDKSKSIVLSVTYAEERQLSKDGTGVIVYISTITPRFSMGSLLVGNKYNGIRFSCRLSNYPRVLYAIKPLFSKTITGWWRIYVIRNRIFRDQSIEPVVDSSMYLNQDSTDMKIISSAIFLKSGDNLVIECEENHDSIYSICRTNDYPNLFKLLPPVGTYEISTPSPPKSRIGASTIFLLICLLLFVIWISIIVGCVISRRIQGLVNMHTEPVSSFTPRDPKRAGNSKTHGVNDGNNQRIAAEGDQTAQMDVEHMGLMS